jgi:hypothetical protein
MRFAFVGLQLEISALKFALPVGSPLFSIVCVYPLNAQLKSVISVTSQSFIAPYF